MRQTSEFARHNQNSSELPRPATLVLGGGIQEARPTGQLASHALGTAGLLCMSPSYLFRVLPNREPVKPPPQGWTRGLGWWAGLLRLLVLGVDKGPETDPRAGEGEQGTGGRGVVFVRRRRSLSG